ncbi:MAG: ribonuclease III [Oscillospiraceae bacterium]|jgi:ribonuclease-3|nr:ribonuclease III [Oscillospiraceae bacterium]
MAIGYDYNFRDTLLRERALTHSSFANEKGLGKLTCNERLEFLGDSILGFITAEYIFKAYPKKPEGEMTKLRAELVCEASLSDAAKRIGLDGEIKLGKGEAANGGNSRPSILADAFEAMLAAIYLDGGYGAAKSFVETVILGEISSVVPAASDNKSRLQELTQRLYGIAPVYKLIGESGPDHDKLFTVEVIVNVTGGTKTHSAIDAKGTGRTKKEAEQSAAGAILASIDL